METEKQVEDHLIKKVEELGGICYKFVSPGRANVLDRLCVMPGLIVFVECKKPDGVVSKGQKREMKRLDKLGALSAVVYSRFEVVLLTEHFRKAVEEYVRLR